MCFEEVVLPVPVLTWDCNGTSILPCGSPWSPVRGSFKPPSLLHFFKLEYCREIIQSLLQTEQIQFSLVPGTCKYQNQFDGVRFLGLDLFRESS